MLKYVEISRSCKLSMHVICNHNELLTTQTLGSPSYCLSFEPILSILPSHRYTQGSGWRENKVEKRSVIFRSDTRQRIDSGLSKSKESKQNTDDISIALLTLSLSIPILNFRRKEGAIHMPSLSFLGRQNRSPTEYSRYTEI